MIRNWIFKCLWIPVLVGLLTHCSNNNEVIAGWGSETTNGISGAVTDGEGNVAQADIAVFPVSYNPVADGPLPSHHLTKTNSLGEYHFNNISAGRYNIKVFDPPSGKAGMVKDLNFNLDPLQVPDIWINKSKTIVVSTKNSAIKEKGYVYIPGTDIYTRVGEEELDEGLISLTGVPDGNYGQLVFYNENSGTFHDVVEAPIAFVQDTFFLTPNWVASIRDGMLQEGGDQFVVNRPVHDAARYKSGNVVSGILRDPTGSPVEDVQVTLMPNEYNPAKATDEITWSTRTNREGVYKFKDIPVGNYRIESIHQSRNLVSLQNQIQVTGDYTVLLPNNMSIPGKLIYYLPEDLEELGGTVYLMGSSHYKTIDEEDLKRGSVVFNSITPKHYTSLVYYGNGGASLDLYQTISIKSDFETIIHPYQGWKHWKSIVYTTPQTAGGLSEELLGFPLLIRLSAYNFNFSQSDGSDLRFTDGRNQAPLDYSIESWDASTQSAAIWVRLDTVQTLNPRHVINMHWGKIGVTSKSNSELVFRKSEGYSGVWQFDGEFVNGSSVVFDKSGNGNHGVTENMSSEAVSEGVAGNALLFDGTDDLVRIPDAPSLNFGRRDFTMSAFFITGGTKEKNQILCKRNKDIQEAVGNYEFQVESDNRVGTYLENTVENKVGAYDAIASEDKISARTWNHVVIVRKDHHVTMYLNGELQPDSIRVNKNINSSADLLIGMDPYFTNEGHFGYIDEVRISKVARSPAWIKMSYESQKYGARVLEFGPGI